MRIVVLFFILLLTLMLIYSLDHKYQEDMKNKHLPVSIVSKVKNIELPNVLYQKSIPKKIYRCYKDKEATEFRSVFKKTQEIMPDYEQIIYDDDDIEQFIRTNFSKRIYSAYKHINPIYGAAKADFFRYLVLYYHGGVYFDIKTGPIKDPRKIINENRGKLITSYGNGGLPKGYLPNFLINKITGSTDYDWSPFTKTPYMEYQQFYIVCPQGHPVMANIIRQVVSNIEDGVKDKTLYASGKISVVAMSGPISYTLAIKNSPQDNVKIFRFPLDGTVKHHLIDYKKIMKNSHYSKQKDLHVVI